MRRMIQRLIADKRGLAFVEFALVAPFLMLLVFGGIELARYMLIVQKVDKAAYTMADLTAQFMPATAARRDGEIDMDEMNNVVFRQFQELMEPYDANVNGSVIISSIRRERDAVRVKWQIASIGYSDGQTISAVSGLTPASINGMGAGLRDRVASFSGDTAIEMNNMLGYENMIVSEVFFRYRPILTTLLAGLNVNGVDTPFTLGETTLARRLYARPRNGNMICLPPTFTYDECTARPAGSCGANACTDECGGCRPNGREWCTLNTAPSRYVRCVNGTSTNQNLADGCTGIGDVSCPQ